MANPIDIVITKEALSQLDALVTKTRTAQTEVLKLAQDALTASRSLSNISTPSGLNNNSSNNANTSSAIQQQTAIIVASQNKIQQAYERSRLADLKLQQQREKSVDVFTKNELKAQQALSRSENLYNKVQQKVNSLIGTYNNLATKQQLGLKLSISEEAQLKSITPRLQKYQDVLKGVDANIGKYGRNVGNYSSATKNLNASIGQISRELPNFGQSFSIGILSLTNNIGALQDAISQTIAQNKILKAEGKQTTSVLSSIGGAILSWTTGLYIAIGLFSAFSKEIGDFFTATIKGFSTFNAVKESIKAIGEATKEGAKNAVQETLALKSNLEIAKDVNLSYKERLIAVDNLQKQYPFYFENLTKEQILAGDTAKAEEALTLAILSRAKAQAATTKITENQGKIIELEEQRIEVAKRLERAELDVASAQQVRRSTTGGGTVIGTYDLETSALTRLTRAKGSLSNIDKEIAGLNAINNRLTTYALENQKKSIGLDYQLSKSKDEVKRKKIEDIEIESRGYDSLIENIEKQIFLIQTLQKSMSTSHEQWKDYEKTISDLNRLIDSIKNGQKELNENAEKGVKTLERENQARIEQIERMEALQKATAEYISTLSNSFLADAGLGSLDQFFNGTFDKLMAGAVKINEVTGQVTDDMAKKFAITFLAISEVAQEAFNFIDQASQRNFDAEYSRLEMQKEVALKFAGESTTAQEEIKRQYDERRKAIQQREAEAQKKLAVFNILINTAQGVVSALASTPPNVPLSIAIGIIGALQAGIVQSQPIPQFFEGGTHKGGIMMVNDAKGNSYKETVVTPDGKVIKPQGRNVLMNAPSGTEIFTPEQWREKEMALSNMLAEKGISLNQNVMRNFAFGGSTGISKTDFDNGINKLSGTIKNAPTSQVTFDELGYRKFQKQNGIKKQRLNNRFNINGK